MADQSYDGSDPGFDERVAVEAARSGDEFALGQLYDHYLPRIHRFCYNRLGSREDAEDVTAEALLRVVDNLHRFAWRDGTPFAAWVFRIARNEVVTYLRRKNHRVPTQPIDDAATLAVEDDELGAIEQVEALQLVREATKRLSQAQREVIELRFIAGLTVAETARALGKSENNVKVLQHKAIANLRTRLNPQ